MKIRLIASFDKHSKFFLLAISFLCNTYSLVGAKTLVTQFRTPLSLGELLHEGLLVVQQDIEQIGASDNDNTEMILTDVLQKMERLQGMYDLMNTKSGFNGIHGGEGNFLQSLIDRIDHMIKNLENSSSDVDENVDLIKKNIDLLQTLRSSLEH